MVILMDTNILGRLSQPTHHQHGVTKEAVKLLRKSQEQLRVVPQVLYEYWAIATRKPEHNGLGFTTEQAAEQLAQSKQHFPPLRDERGVLESWEQLVERYRVEGKASHDTRLVAAMVRHGLVHILTFNLGDFKRFSEVTAISPTDIVAGNFTLPLA